MSKKATALKSKPEQTPADPIAVALANISESLNTIDDRLGGVDKRLQQVEDTEEARRTKPIPSRGTHMPGQGDGPRDKPVVPVTIHKTYESEQNETAQVGTRTFNDSNEMETGLIEPVKLIDRKKMEILRFMEDVLTIRVADTTDKNAEPYPKVTVNGINQFFIRGREQQVKRKFVAVLLQSKPTVYGNELFERGDGVEDYRYPSHTALGLQFETLEDPAGEKGRQWAKALQAAA